MPQGSANLNIMIKVARKAGRALMRDFGEVEALLVSVKSPGEFVTKADEKSQETIHEELMEARPNYGFLGEETPEIPGKDPTRRWIVDPLDGTTNFLHGQPHWSVSIALEHKGEVIAAVIYDPIKDELYTSEKGEGAWLNGRRLRVSGRSEMTEMLFSTGIPFAGQPRLPETLKDLARVMPTCAGVRQYGATSLDLAYVAAGRFDAYWDTGLHPWNMAGGLLLVKEAGGLVEAYDNEKSPLVTGDVIAANETVFNRFAALIRNT